MVIGISSQHSAARCAGNNPLIACKRANRLAGTLGTNGPEWASWTSERTAYLGAVLQKMLRGYTEAAVSVTSTLVTFVSRFALQVGSTFTALKAVCIENSSGCTLRFLMDLATCCETGSCALVDAQVRPYGRWAHSKEQPENFQFSVTYGLKISQ